MDRLFRRLAAAAAALLLAVPASALTVGTFDIEDFHIAGTSGVSRKSAPYDQRDMRDLARAVRKSRADVLALQEVEGDATMRYFAVTAMHGWKYAGNDTAGVQDLYFMWDPKKVTLQGRVQALKANLSRTPVAARFADSATGRTYTLVNAHLDNTAADEQMKELYRCAKTLPQPVILLCNFGDPDLEHPDVAFRKLEGGFSCDDSGSSPDFIGCLGISSDKLGKAKETETSIRRRSSKRREHPSHDIITVEVFK